MAAMNFLAGIGGAFQAVQKGMDDAQVRKDADQQRKWREDDRAFQTEQRGIWRNDQQRKDDEWQRGERLRKADAEAYEKLGTEEDQAPAPTAAPLPAAAPKPPAAATVSPGATADTVTPPDPSLGDRGVASVKDATMAPGYKPPPGLPPADPGAQAQDAQPLAATTPATATPKRKVTYGDVLRQMAKSRSKEGMTADAIKFNDEATKWDLDQANRRLTTLIGGADTMSLEDYANSAKTLFNSDPLPQSITGVKVNPDKTVTVTIKHSESGAQTTRTFKDKNELTSTLQSFYQPEAFNKLRQATAETASRRREELLKPFTLKPGEVRQVFDETSGKVVTIGEGGVKPGYELVQGADGSATMRPIPKDGKAGKATDQLAAFTDSVEFALKNAATEGRLPAGQVATANRIARQIGQSAIQDDRNVDPSVATEIAIGVASGSVTPKIKYDPVKGRVLNTAEFQGNNFTLEDFGDHATTRLPKEKMAEVAAGYVQSLSPEKRKQIVGAAFDGANRAAFESEIRASLSSPVALSALQKRLGREPTKADIEIAALSAIGTADKSLNLVSKYMPETKDWKSTYADIMGKPEKTEKPEGKKAIGDVGGMYKRPTLAQRQQAVQSAKERMAVEEADAVRTAAADAQRLLQAGDVTGLARLQASSAFNKLDKATKTAIYNRVNGLQ